VTIQIQLRDSADRQFEVTCENSRTISDSMYGRVDSFIIQIAQTLPMWDTLGKTNLPA